MKKLFDSLAEKKHFSGLTKDQFAKEAAHFLAEINAIGALVKDLEMGLVDFPCHVEGSTVLLCWKLGEQRITHWHGTGEGFAGRKPITERIARAGLISDWTVASVAATELHDADDADIVYTPSIVPSGLAVAAARQERPFPTARWLSGVSAFDLMADYQPPQTALNLASAQRPNQFVSIFVGHSQIGEKQVRPALGDQFERLPRGRCRLDARAT